jgi:hypothetical protein
VQFSGLVQEPELEIANGRWKHVISTPVPGFSTKVVSVVVYLTSPTSKLKRGNAVTVEGEAELRGEEFVIKEASARVVVDGSVTGKKRR